MTDEPDFDDLKSRTEAQIFGSARGAEFDFLGLRRAMYGPSPALKEAHHSIYARLAARSAEADAARGIEVRLSPIGSGAQRGHAEWRPTRILSSRPRALVGAAVLAIFVVGTLLALQAVFDLRPDGVATASPQVPSASPQVPSASPQVPKGFASCSSYGEDVFCPVEPECWAAVQSVGDEPVLATPIECTDSYAYQTFIAVKLPQAPRTQSELQDNPAIKQLCTKTVLNQRLAQGRAGASWDVLAILHRVFPDPDDLSRCLVSTGRERTSPVALKPG